MLIDGANTMIRAHVAHATLSTASGQPTGATFGFMRSVVDSVRRFDPRRVVVAWEGGRSRWRRAIFPGYKDRPKTDDSGRWDDCFVQREGLERLLQAFGVDQVRAPGVEADDAIAWLALNAHASDRVVIFSKDRDFLQLVDDRVTVLRSFSTMKDGDEVTLDTFEEVAEHESPDDYLLFRIVNGDGSDMIPRVDGLSGVKRYVKVRQALRQAYGVQRSADVLACPACPAAKASAADPTLVGRIRAGWADMHRNAVLMDLRFAARLVSDEQAAAIAAPSAGRWDGRAATVACAALEFATVLRDLDHVKLWNERRAS